MTPLKEWILWIERSAVPLAHLHTAVEQAATKKEELANQELCQLQRPLKVFCTKLVSLVGCWIFEDALVSGCSSSPVCLILSPKFWGPSVA